MSDKRYCLQCGAELSLMAVPRDDKYPSDAVPACSACGSKAYDVPGNVIQEIKRQHTELIDKIRKSPRITQCLYNEYMQDKTHKVEVVKWEDIEKIIEGNG